MTEKRHGGARPGAGRPPRRVRHWEWESERSQLSPESDLSICQARADGRHGIVIGDAWYSAAEAQAIAAYLQDRREWLMDTRHVLIAYARRIAQYRGYTDLVNGLQPLERLREKYQREIEKFKDALAHKSWLHQLHEASDVIYYAACSDEQADSPESDLYSAALRECTQLIRFHGTPVTDKQIEAAARAKYGWRASDKDNKDEAHELVLIEQVVSK